MLYYLVDSNEADRMVYSTKLMDEIELAQERERCEIHGGGEFIWLPASKEMAALPKHEVYKHALISCKDKS